MKNLKLVLVLMGLALSISFCGKQEGAGDDTVTLWMPPFGGSGKVLDQDFWEETLAPFAESNNFTLNVSIIPWRNYEEKYMTAIGGGVSPDIGYGTDNLLSDFQALGAVQAFDECITPADRENFIYIDYGIYNGEQIAMPFVVGNPRILFYNKTLLDEIGEKPPVTWEDFLRLAQKATKDTDGDGEVDQWGFIQPWGIRASGTLNSTFYPFLFQAGGQIFTDDGTGIGFNNEAGRRSLQFISDLKDKYKVMPSTVASMESEATALFTAGKVLFIMEGARHAINMEVAGMDWGYVPGLTDKKHATVQVVDQLIMLSSVSPEKKPLVFKVMRHILSKEVMEKFHATLASFAPITRDAEYKGIPKLADLHSAENNKVYLRKNDQIRGTAAANEVMQRNIQRIILGEVTVQEALDIIDKEAKNVLSVNKKS